MLPIPSINLLSTYITWTFVFDLQRINEGQRIINVQLIILSLLKVGFINFILLLDKVVLDTEFTKKTQSSQRITRLVFKPLCALCVLCVLNNVQFLLGLISKKKRFHQTIKQMHLCTKQKTKIAIRLNSELRNKTLLKCNFLLLRISSSSF